MKPKGVNQKSSMKKSAITKKKKDLSEVTTEEFFQQDFESDTDSDDNDEDNKNIDKNSKQRDSDSSESNLDPMEHKKSLMKLKDTDPEFYKFLKENDKNLLDFNMSDDNDDNDHSSIDKSDNRHIPNENLEIASDDDDFEPEETEGDSKKKITLQLLKTWQQEIQMDRSAITIKNAVEAFHAALDSVAVSPDGTVRYKVEGSAIFNGVVQLCIMYLPDAFECFLKLDPQFHEAHKSKRFRKIRGILKSYLTDLIKLLQNIASPNIQTVLLKHLRQVIAYTQSFSSLIKPLLRILLKLWCETGDETVRVVAFLNISYVATRHKELEKLLKTMYVKYVQNAKFVSPNTLPGINFMRHSLVEIYLLDQNLSYNHAFLFIRQLAIHLRNAVTLKKKENFQIIYNWQYINSLHFWMDLIIKSKEKSMLRPLAYPLVQIIIGTIKLIPTVQYYPLRFHCVKMLINISKGTGMVIPHLPFLLEILDSYDFNKRHKTVSMKPLPLFYILRVSKSQLIENGFKDSVIETIYKLILEHAANESHRIYFPDLYIPCIIKLKAFLKKCHVASYCRKMKQLLGMIEENRKYIETERTKITIDLKNTTEITNWENKIETKGTAIAKFYATWIKIHESQKLKLLTKNDENFSVPVVARSKKHKLDEQDTDDSEEESELDFRLKGTGTETETEKPTNTMKKKRNKKVKKLANITEDEELPRENTDIVRDVKSDDWD